MTRSERFVLSFSLSSGADCRVACVLTIVTPLTCGISLQVYFIFLFIRVFSLENDSSIPIMTGIYAEGKLCMCYPPTTISYTRERKEYLTLAGVTTTMDTRKSSVAKNYLRQS